MNQETKALVWDLLKVGLVGTAIGIPIGVWAMKRWPTQTWKTALLLTGVGFAVKEVMLHRAPVEAAAELAGADRLTAIANGYTMPAPKRGRGVYWRGRTAKGDGAVFRRALPPTR